MKRSKISYIIVSWILVFYFTFVSYTYLVYGVEYSISRLTKGLSFRGEILNAFQILVFNVLGSMGSMIFFISFSIITLIYAVRISLKTLI